MVPVTRIVAALVAGLALLDCCVAAAQSSSTTAEGDSFAGKVSPFLRKYCLDCHGEKKQSGKVRFDGPPPDFRKESEFKVWESVRKQLTSGAMPPEERPGPSAEEMEPVIEWIGANLRLAAIESRGGAGRRPLRRLTREEYGNSIRDLFGLHYERFDLTLGERLPAEGLGAAFQNDADALTIQPLHLQRFLESAERVLDIVLVSGARPTSYRYHVDLSKLAAVPSKGAASTDWDGIFPDSEGTTKLKAKAVMVEPIPDVGIALPPAYANLQTSDGVRLLLTMPIEAPRSGVIRVRLRAHAETPAGQSDPLLRLTLHYRDNNYVYIPLAATRVTHSAERPGDVVFEIPIDFVEGTWEVVRRQKQMTLMITNETIPVGDREVAKNQKKGQKWPWAEPRIVLHSVEVETPYYASWPPPLQTRLLDAPAESELDKARIVLKRFMTRAYRRPATEPELERMTALFAAARPKSADFASAIKAPLAAILCSPKFLCLVETKTEMKSRLSDHELAARLSYFLWNTMPDDALLERADRRQLSEPQTLDAEVRRLLADPRSEAFVRSFATQWLGLEHLAHIQKPFCDPLKSPTAKVAQERDLAIKESLAEEPVRFLLHAIERDLPPRVFADADFVMVNDRLAEYYGIQGVVGPAFRKVAPAPAHRAGGLLTQAGVIAAASEGNDQAIVRRGVYVMTRLLDLEVGTPPANVLPLAQQASKDSKFAKLTERQQLKQHTAIQSCAVCHNRIDPLGFAWNDYNGLGQFGAAAKKARDTDTSGRLPDRTAFKDFAEFRSILANGATSRRSLSDGFARRLLAYALGRSLDFSDEPTVRRIDQRIAADNLGVAGIIGEIVRSEPFLSK